VAGFSTGTMPKFQPVLTTYGSARDSGRNSLGLLTQVHMFIRQHSI
jgi:hypothetical protein